MADYDDYSTSEGLSSARLIGRLLTIAGWFGVAASLVYALSTLLDPSQSATPASRIATICIMFGGLVASALVFGLGELLRQFDGFTRFYEQNISTTRQAASREAASQRDSTSNMDELVVLLREVRDISLLSDGQRSKRLEAQGRAAVGVLQREVPVLLREHNWIEARHRVQEARERFPTFAVWDEFERQIEQMRAQVEAHDFENAERQIRDLIALSAWDRVGEVVRELLQRHPESPRALELAQRVRGQRSKAETEQRTKLMVAAQEATNARDWRTAISHANQLIQRFPKTPEAQALQLQLPTLRVNAEIQTRQQMESQYTNLVKARRFTDAARVARDVIDQYPDSPQAEVMRQQLPRLEARAAAV